jgi:NAD(P)-dependent dehydrogenase (short-subunit alcohol dehydrogenase family)
VELRNCKALVTGGGVRIGRAIAVGLAAAGCDIALQYHRSRDGAEETAASVAAHGRRAILLAADLADAEAAATLMARARAEIGDVDVLINSAGIFLPGDLAGTTLADWERQLALNLRAPFLLSQAFARQDAATDRPRKIVNVADARIRRPARDHLAYRLTKVALAHLTELLALELAPRITVNAVAPGAILPPPGEGAAAFEQRVRARVPLGRAGGTAAVAGAVLYLLREDFVTGVVLPVDGGEFL